jgi:hypothetical protein
VEGFNKSLMKFLKKDQIICFTIEKNKVRIHLALGLQSVGFQKFYKHAFK